MVLIFASMSKRTKNKPRKQPSNSKIKKVRSGVVPKKKEPVKQKIKKATPNKIEITSPKDPLYRKIFWGIAGFILLITTILALNSGINGDDEFQVDYSNKLVSYYTTFGADSSALYVEKGNMHYYGGFFDLLAGMTNYILGYDEFDLGFHNIRHIYNALFGCLAMIFTGLLVKRIAGWRAGILALVLMFLSPRFLGHSFMNPKDIPFAAGFAVALYYMVALMEQLPKIKWQSVLGLSLGLALAIATRAGGLLLIAYLGLFLGIDFLMKYGFKGLTNNLKAVGNYALVAITASVSSYFLAILTWPAALANPFGHPFEALSKFSELGIKIRLLFQAENIMSDEIAWNYPIVWILYTIPLFALIGFIGAFIIAPQLTKRYQPVPIYLLLFASVFPVAYVIYKDSTLHDGWRHLMFIYPSLLALAALFWVTMEDWLQSNKIATYALMGVFAITALEPLVFTLRNTAFPYVYFNPIAGGISSAFGNYETDYWGVSVKQALNWMEKEGILSENMQDTVTIGTSFYFNVSRATRGKFDGKVKTKYVRFNQRYNENWDYGIFPSRFIRSGHLKSKNWPNKKAVHVINANGVPLTAIEKSETENAFLGHQAMKAKNWSQAVKYLKQEVDQYPDNELAWGSLANAYVNLGDNANAINAAQNALLAAPKNESALYYLGLGQMRSGKANEAVNTLLQLLEINPDYYIASYYLGAIYQQNKQFEFALKYALQSIEKNGKFKSGYELVGAIYNEMGDSQNAQRYLQAAAKL